MLQKAADRRRGGERPPERRVSRSRGKVSHNRNLLTVNGITALNRDSPDASRAEVNICAFPTFPQDRRELRTAAGTWGGRNGGRRIELVIFPGIWTHSFCRLRLNA